MPFPSALVQNGHNKLGGNESWSANSISTPVLVEINFKIKDSGSTPRISFPILQELAFEFSEQKWLMVVGI